VDAVGAVLDLAGMPGVACEDRRVVLECVKEHGIDKAALALCSIYYAFRLLPTDREGVLRWCIVRIRQASE
jgi:hypothetical protein